MVHILILLLSVIHHKGMRFVMWRKNSFLKKNRGKEQEKRFKFT